MLTDPDRLRQILLNLVGNAVKYTDTGEVRLGVEVENGTVCLAVRDTGTGIPEEHRDRIFEPFWQLDPDQRTRYGGTGLGLSVVRRLVGLLGGCIGVDSEVGRGSTFTVKLPLTLRRQLLTARAARQAPSMPRLKLLAHYIRRV